MVLTSEHNQLYKDIDEILWNYWDPINVNDIAPRDEYQNYTSIIYNLKINGSDNETVARKLYEIETVSIGVDGNMDHCRQIADRIINL